MNVAVLGASGMLGAMVTDVLSRDHGLRVVATVRDGAAGAALQSAMAGVSVQSLDAESATVEQLARLLDGAACAVNAIGVIKPYIRDDRAAEVQRAVTVNALFPHVLARAAETTGCRIIQIATDCVYSGQKGAYTEADPHDALDVYGKSKSLGEVSSPAVTHLRCSIIGPEPKAHVSLLDWFRRQPAGASLNGFRNHQWNGVTTYHFARLCQGIITNRLWSPGVQHAVPTGSVSKYDMLIRFARCYGRDDLTVNAVDAATVIDRTLGTKAPEANRRLWAAAGYREPPTVEAMIDEMASFDCRFVEAAR